MQVRRSVRWLLTTQLLLPLVAAEPTFAQPPAPPASEEEELEAAEPREDQQEIIVTGSRIPRPNLTAVSPVTVVDGEEIKLYGTILAEELVNTLPQVVPDQGNFLSNSATGTATVNLRGLGPERTLVLVNGRRLLPGDPEYTAPDINTVPAALIERVDVLTGGASSVYGSDAVAGVVNFILNTGFTGFRIDSQYSLFQHENRDGADVRQALIRRNFPFPKGNEADGGSSDVNAVFGSGFADGRGHVTAYGGYRRMSELTQDQRDYSACAVQGRADSDILDCGGSAASATGTFVTNFGPFRLGSDRSFVPGVTLYNFAPTNYYQRPGRRYIAGGFAELELNEMFEPYAEVMFMDDRSVAQIAPSGNFFRTTSINCDSPLLSEQQRSIVCRPGNFVGEIPVFDQNGALVRIEGSPRPFVDPVTGASYFRGVLRVGRRNVEGGPRQDEIAHRNMRLLGGVRGDLGAALSYDGHVLFGRAKSNGTFTEDLSIARLGRALDVVTGAGGEPVCRSVLTGEDPDCVPWDVFALGAVSPEAAAYLTQTGSRSGSVTQKVATASVIARLGEWGIRSPWSDEAPALNVGAEYRQDKLDFRPDEVLSSGDLAGFPFPPLPVEGSTKVSELFGEVRVPVIAERFIHNLSFEAGYRQSWQSNSESSFTTNSYKLGLDLSPVRAIRLRASYQRAVRAPNVRELFGPEFQSSFQRDPCAGISPTATLDQCARTGVSAVQYGNILANPFPFGGYNAIAGGNPALEPENATTRSIGAVLRPLPGLSATIDWFEIDVERIIVWPFAQEILNTCIETGDPLFCSRVHRDASGSLWLTPEGFVDERNMNIGGARTRGIDVGANFDRNIGRLGSIELGVLGTWLDKFTIDNGGLSIAFDCTGLYGPSCGLPRPEWRHKARLTWSPARQVALSLQWRHIGKVRLDSASGDPELAEPFLPANERIEAQDFFDLTGMFRIGGSYLLRLGVRNIFDREPPLVASGIPGIPGACFPPFCNGNTYPQLYDPLGRYFFAGVTVDFNR